MEEKNIIESLSFNIDDFVNSFEFQGQNIVYKCYLPINEKLRLATDVVNVVIGDNRFANPGKIKVYEVLYFIQYYTDLDIIEYIDTNALNTYDKIITSGLYDGLLQDKRLTNDWEEVEQIIKDTLKNIYEYNNSALGVLEAAAADYNDLSFDVEKLQKEVSDPNNLTLLKDVMTKLG